MPWDGNGKQLQRCDSCYGKIKHLKLSITLDGALGNGLTYYFCKKICQDKWNNEKWEISERMNVSWNDESDSDDY